MSFCNYQIAMFRLVYIPLSNAPLNQRKCKQRFLEYSVTKKTRLFFLFECVSFYFHVRSKQSLELICFFHHTTPSVPPTRMEGAYVIFRCYLQPNANAIRKNTLNTPTHLPTARIPLFCWQFRMLNVKFDRWVIVI